MNPENETIYCTNCGVEISWLPLVKDGHIYCCQDCLQYLACNCAGLFEQEEERLTSQRSIVDLPAVYSG